MGCYLFFNFEKTNPQTFYTMDNSLSSLLATKAMNLNAVFTK